MKVARVVQQQDGAVPPRRWRCESDPRAPSPRTLIVRPVVPNVIRSMIGARPQQVATLARLWLVDALPKNAESRVIGVVLRLLRRDGEWKALLSYADPAAGHVGTIYQATGWIYLGQGAPPSYVDLGDGKALHPRTVYDRLGSNAVGHLRRTGIPARRAVVSGKHRYAYVLDPSWRWRLRGRPQSYPRLGVP